MNIKMTSTKFTPINEVTIPDIYYRRMKCGIEKLDALFGEGILPGSSITLTARAGLGKTTLVLQMLESLHKNGYKVGYCSSEESVAQLAMTCKRLNVQNISVCNEANVDKISSYMEEHDVIVIDSFQGLVKGNSVHVGLLSLFRNVCDIEEERQNLIHICGGILRPRPTRTQNAIHISIHCLLKSCVLRLADVLEKEDSFKEAEKEDMNTESQKTIVPFFTGTIVTWNNFRFRFCNNRGYGWACCCK